ncbi:MAG TPA: FAD-linked oxidase C-terminal domain-containing protein [Chthoniobacterales bacterium]|jgi:glycolate oxidase subunit GlcD|nr:FAD-linked oxidase C-terminal domain-containing protein [Chthoniobacterales bacterium]
MDLYLELSALLGAEIVSKDRSRLEANSCDKWFASHLPDVVVEPRSAEQISKLLRFANERKIPVTARGAGYGYVGGCVPEHGGIALALIGMNRIKEIAVADGVAVVEPGVITGDLQREARNHRLFYPPDPASLKNSSIGGNIATNAGGPRSLKYGVTRHYVLGLEVVLADGTIVRVGGRTHKNKTGFDLVGLFVGSEGMLGIVTEAILRLLPLPTARASISASFPTVDDAAAAVQMILLRGFLPSALEIADRFTLEAARRHLGREIVPDGNAHLLLDLDGHGASVRSEMEALSAIIKSLGALTLQSAFGDQACESLWDLRRGFSESLKATGLTKLNEDVTVPRGKLVQLMKFAGDLQAKYGFPIACFGHAGDGNIHVNVMVADLARAEVRQNLERALDDLFGFVIASGGAITGEHGIGLAKKRWWPQAVSPESLLLHQTVKRALDPAGILNPGKFL